MNRQIGRLASLSGLLTMGVFLLLAIGCGGDSSQAESRTAASATPAAQAGRRVGGHPGDQAPDFSLVDLEGQTLHLRDFRGNVVLVDFWATWCPPCKLAMPHLQEIQEKYGDKGVTILAISVDRKGPGVVRSFIAQNGYTFKVVMTDNQVDRQFGGIRGIPTTFVIGPDGTVSKRFTGYQDKSVYLKAITDLKPELVSTNG